MTIKLNPCPYCDGTGERMVRKKHRLTNIVMPAISMCICSQSKFISSQYNRLDYLRDYYKPIEEIEKTFIFDPTKLQDNPNYIIHGTQRCFHLHVKSMLMKYRFSDPKASLWFSSSIDIIHDFHVRQEDGDSPHLSSTDAFDLLIVAFGVMEENKALKYGMAQILSNRKYRKPVWIYVPTPTIGGCAREYSPELEELVKDYKVVHINCGSDDSGPELTKSMETAANFTGLTR